MLSAQRWRLESHPHGRELTREWAQAVDQARAQGGLIVLIQRDGAPDIPGETLSRGWTLPPDFRVDAGDTPKRAAPPDAFAHANLAAELRAHTVRELILLALPYAPELAATAQAAQAAGLGVQVLEVSALA